VPRTGIAATLEGHIGRQPPRELNQPRPRCAVRFAPQSG